MFRAGEAVCVGEVAALFSDHLQTCILPYTLAIIRTCLL